MTFFSNSMKVEYLFSKALWISPYDLS